VLLLLLGASLLVYREFLDAQSFLSYRRTKDNGHPEFWEHNSYSWGNRTKQEGTIAIDSLWRCAHSKALRPDSLPCAAVKEKKRGFEGTEKIFFILSAKVG